MDFMGAWSRIVEVFTNSLQDGTAGLFGPESWFGGYIIGFALGVVLSKGSMDRYETVSGMYRFSNWTFMRVGMWLFLFGMPMAFLAAKVGLITEQPPPDFKPISLTVGAFLFGSAQAVAGYCPGVGLAALGRGALDALVWAGGLVVGNIFFAQVIYGSTLWNLMEYVNLGKLTFSKLMFGLGYATSWFEFPFILGFILMFVVMIIIMALFDGFIKWFDKSFSWILFKEKPKEQPKNP
jgi:hypothetical protein